MNIKTFQIRKVIKDDKPWITKLLKDYWGNHKIITRGRIHFGNELPGFITIQDGKQVGHIAYRLEDDECEIISLISLIRGIGIGTKLLNAVKKVAVSSYCKRIWLITTNDNTPALSFYQTRGYSIVAVYPNAIEQYRKLKPEIPLYGLDSIPIRDEIELEMILSKNVLEINYNE